MILKRGMDLLIAIPLFCLLLPLAGVLSLWIALSMGRPVLFVQQRPGYKSRPFFIAKFRTMRDGIEDDAHRLTALGRFLRKTSLDEIPQLWNVITGDLSLVGPRPLLMEYLPLYSNEEARRHDVLPGITGWAQINGRNAISWEEKFKLDLWYVDHQSIFLDCRILFLTVMKVVRRHGISASNAATMPKFTGTHHE